MGGRNNGRKKLTHDEELEILEDIINQNNTRQMLHIKNNKQQKFKKVKLNEISFTENQKKFKELIYNNTITFCTGPAGSSKTFTACVTAIELLNKGIVDRIIFTKPIEESGTKLGLLPGNVDEKILPYLASYYDTLSKIMDSADLKTLIDNKIIEFKPTAFMRGVTYDRALMVSDESQNFDARELMLFITRLGNDSKIIIMGDVSQYDINYDTMGLIHIIKMLEGINSIGSHIFTNLDIVRNKILIEITERYEKYKAENKLGKMKKS